MLQELENVCQIQMSTAVKIWISYVTYPNLTPPSECVEAITTTVLDRIDLPFKIISIVITFQYYSLFIFWLLYIVWNIY